MYSNRRILMRWIFLTAAIVTAAFLASPMSAAPPDPAEATMAAPGAAEQSISFEQYRDWRLHFIEQRQTQLAAQLTAANLTSAQRSRLEQQKAYYDWYAGLPDTDRDHRFRERFDQIDTNHDGIIDPTERAAWHDKQRAFYDRGRSRQQAAAHDVQ
jgi:hypothetical protein